MFARVAILASLRRDGPGTCKEIAERTGRDRHAVSRVLRLLRARSQVENASARIPSYHAPAMLVWRALLPPPRARVPLLPPRPFDWRAARDRLLCPRCGTPDCATRSHWPDDWSAYELGACLPAVKPAFATAGTVVPQPIPSGEEPGVHPSGGG